MRLKMKKLINKIKPFVFAGFYYFAAAVFIVGFTVASSIIKIGDLFILEIVLFGNLAAMLLIIPVMIFLRK
jgi:hypothetical protein